MRSRATWFVGAAIAVVVAVALVVAITQTEDVDQSAAGTVSEVQTVTVSGEALPVLSADPGTDAAVGRPAPVLDGLGFTGNEVTTAPGAPTLVVFLAHWCPHCQAEVPVLVRAAELGAFPSGLDVVAVATSTDPSRPNYPPSAWLAAEKWPPLWPVLADDAAGSAGAAFGLSGFPFMVLVGADGTVLWRHSGEITLEDLQASLEDLLG